MWLVLSLLLTDPYRLLSASTFDRTTVMEIANQLNLSIDPSLFVNIGYVNNSLTIDKDCKGCEHYINDLTNDKLILEYRDIYTEKYQLEIEPGVYRIVSGSACLIINDCVLITNAKIGAIRVDEAMYSVNVQNLRDTKECKIENFDTSPIEICTTISSNSKYLFKYRVTFSVRPSSTHWAAQEWDMGLRAHKNLYSYYPFLDCEEVLDSACQ